MATLRHQGWGKRRLLPGTRDGGEKVLGDERLAPILAMVGSMASHREPARDLQVAVRQHTVGAHFALPVAFYHAWYYRADLDARKTFLPSYLQKNGDKSGQWEEWPGLLFSQHPLVAATFLLRKVQHLCVIPPSATGFHASQLPALIPSSSRLVTAALSLIL